MKPSPMAQYMGSTYVLAKGVTGDAAIFGEFPNCRIMGSPCTIKVEPLPDGDPRALDILGFPSFRRGGLAIHISGLDDYGSKDAPRKIHALAMYEVVWDRPGHHCTGLGCDEPEPAVVLSGEAEHFAHWGGTDSFVTLEGIYLWDAVSPNAFSADDVLAYINRGRADYLALGGKQKSAIRLLLETAVETTNYKIPGDKYDAYLVRHRKRQYQWVRRGAV